MAEAGTAEAGMAVGMEAPQWSSASAVRGGAGGRGITCIRLREYGYGYPAAYPYSYPNYGYGEYHPAPTYDTGAYVERPDAGYQGGQLQQYQGGQTQGGQITSDGYVYYCPNPAGYYPQVPSCAAGWLRVVPQGGPGPNAPGQR
jgi:hypothetical protein